MAIQLSLQISCLMVAVFNYLNFSVVEGQCLMQPVKGKSIRTVNHEVCQILTVAPAITQRAAYQLTRKMVPVSTGRALEITDPLLETAGTKWTGTALAFTAMVIKTKKSP